MTSTAKTYESVAILNAALEDPQIDATVDKLQEFITKQGGSIRALDKRGRKRLAFPIKKKNNGFFIVLEFDAPPDAITKLARYFALDENIIRYLTIQLDSKMLKGRELEKSKEESPSAPAGKPDSAEQTS